MVQKKLGINDGLKIIKNPNNPVTRQRAQTTKTVNEVKRETTLYKQQKINTLLPQQKDLEKIGIVSEMTNLIINNDILEEMNVEEEIKVINIEPQMDDNMMTDDVFTMKSINLSLAPNDVVLNPRPQLVEEYIPEIFQHLKEIEFDNLPQQGYMKNQTDINEKMRGILIDWLVEVHLKFKLLPETLFLTVNLIDRYLERRLIMRNRLQLVGVTAMLIACKYEEIYAPEVRDFVYITDKAYSREEILSMENELLSALDYNVTVPSSFRYLEIYNYFLKVDESSFMFCRYLLELFLIDYKMLKFNPSLLAASTLYLTLKITKKDEIEKITDLTEYSEDKLKECAKDVCVILNNVENGSLQAVRKKFATSKYLEVSKIKFN